MGYYAVVGGSTAAPLASLTGWADFKAWADTLDHEIYPGIVHLCEHAWAQDLHALAGELHAALKDHSPADNTVVSTAIGILAAIPGAPGGAESIFVSDGTTSVDVKDDWHDGD